MGSEYGGTIEFTYATDSRVGERFTRAELLEQAQADWREFIGNPEETLPWNTTMRVSVSDENDWTATVSIRWERAT